MAVVADPRRMRIATKIAHRMFTDPTDQAFFARVLYDSEIPTSGSGNLNLAEDLDSLTLSFHAPIPWEEFEHPRGGHGRFGRKPGVVNHPILKPDEANVHPDLHEKLNQMLDFVPPEDRDRLSEWPPKRRARAVEVLGDAYDTQRKHATYDAQADKWNYTPDRAAHHARILQHLIDAAGPQAWTHEPHAYMTAGTPGAGKSQMLASGKFGMHQSRVKVDPDYMKTLLPEYQLMIHPNWTPEQAWAEIDRLMEGKRRTAIDPKYPPEGFAAAGVHEETYDIAKLVTEYGTTPDAQGRQAHLEIDGTGDSVPGEFVKRLQGLHDKGYKVDVMYAITDLATAFQRAILRAQQHGRWLPLSFLSDTANKIRDVFFDDLMNTDFLNTVSLFDTTTSTKPILLVEPGEGTLRDRIARSMVRNDDRLRDFWRGIV